MGFNGSHLRLFLVMFFLAGLLAPHVLEAQLTTERGIMLSIEKVWEVSLGSETILVDLVVRPEGSIMLLAFSQNRVYVQEVSHTGELREPVKIASTEESFDVVEPLSLEVAGDYVIVYIRGRMGLSEVIKVYKVGGGNGGNVDEIASIELGEGFLVYEAKLTSSGLLVAGSAYSYPDGWKPFIALYTLHGTALWQVDLESPGAFLGIEVSGDVVCGLYKLEEGLVGALCLDIVDGSEVDSIGMQGEVPPAGSLLASEKYCTLVTLGRSIAVAGSNGFIREPVNLEGRVVSLSFGPRNIALILTSSREYGNRGLELHALPLEEGCTPSRPITIGTITESWRGGPVLVGYNKGILGLALVSGKGWLVASYKIEVINLSPNEEAKDYGQNNQEGVLQRGPLELLLSPLLTVTLLIALSFLAGAAAAIHLLAKRTKSRD